MNLRVITFPTIGTSATNVATLLAVDDYHLPLRRNLCYYLSTPTFAPSRCWSRPRRPGRPRPRGHPLLRHRAARGRAVPHVVLRTGLGGRSRLHPRGPHLLCRERRRHLHQAQPGSGGLQGQRPNNAIALPEHRPRAPSSSARTTTPIPPAATRWSTSAFRHRGLQPSAPPPAPMGCTGPAVRAALDEGLEPCSFYKHNGLYIANAQFAPSRERGRAPGRAPGLVWVSPDFDHWLPECGRSAPVARAKRSRGPRHRPSPTTRCTWAWAPIELRQLLVGLYCIWHNAPARPRATGSARGPPRAIGAWSSPTTAALPRAGQGPRLPAPADDPAVSLRRRPAHETILCQANGILNVGDETRIYHGRWANTEHTWRTTTPRSPWPRSRATAGARWACSRTDEGSVWSAPVTLPRPGCPVSLNAEGADDMRVEIADERFRLLPRAPAATPAVRPLQTGLDAPSRGRPQGLRRWAGRRCASV